MYPTTSLIAGIRTEDGVVPTLDVTDVVLFDLLEPDQCAKLIAAIKPDGLVHLAARASVAASLADPLASWRANFLGTIALAEAIIQHVRHCRVVLASSAEANGLSFRAPDPLDELAPLCPANLYAASKAAYDVAIGEIARSLCAG
jgi:GDP-4-dehydro-6-deoxy-D-mannose reductase